MVEISPGSTANITKAQAQTLRFITEDEAVGTHKGDVQVRWHVGASNTGVIDGIDVKGDVVIPKPIINDITLNYGNRTTPANSSTVLIKNIPGLIAPNSPPIAYFRTGNVTAFGGGVVGDWGGLLATNTAIATARTPNPTKGIITQLTTVTLVGGYTYDIIAVGENGEESTATVTINVVADAFNVGDANGGDVMSSRFATKSGGLTWLFTSGWERAGVYALQNLNPTGRTIVTEADPSKPMKMNGLRLYNCQRVDVDGLTMGGTPNHRFLVDTNSTDCTIKNCKSGADASWDYINPTTPNIHAIFKIDNCTYITVEDNHFEWCPRGILIGGANISGNPRATNIIVRNNTFRTYYGDAFSIGGCDTVDITGNTFIAPMRNEGNNDHIDGVQFGGSGADVSANVTIEGNMWIQGEGNAGSIGVMNTSVSVTNLVFRYNILLGRAATSMDLRNNISDSTVEDNTIFLTMSGKIAQYYRATDPQNDNVYNGVQQIVLTTATNSFMRRLLAVGNVGGSFTGWTKEDNLALGISYTAITQFSNVEGQSNYEPTFEPTGVRTYDFSNVFNYANAFERLNNYSADNNAAGTNYTTLTVEQIRTRVLDTLTPKIGGSADLGGSSVIGAITKEGQLKS